MERDDGDAERFRQSAQSVKSLAGQGIRPIHRTEVDVQRRGDQARAAPKALQGRLGVVTRFRRPQVLPILDECQFELVEFQLGDQSKGRLQRLPREAERATGDEHPTLLIRPHQGPTNVAVDSLLAFAVEKHDPPVRRTLDRCGWPLDLYLRKSTSGSRSYLSWRSGGRAEADRARLSLGTPTRPFRLEVVRPSEPTGRSCG